MKSESESETKSIRVLIKQYQILRNVRGTANEIVKIKYKQKGEIRGSLKGNY